MGHPRRIPLPVVHPAHAAISAANEGIPRFSPVTRPSDTTPVSDGGTERVADDRSCSPGCPARADYDQLRAQVPAAFIEMTWPGLEVLYLNAIARALLGYADDDPVDGLSALTLVAPGDRGRLLERAALQLASTVAQGLPYRRQKGQEILALNGLRKDGTTFPAEVQAAFVLDSEGMPIGVRFAFWDITDRVQLEQEKRQLEILVRQSQKLDSLGHLAGGIAHDFNNLLTVIVGNLHLLRPFLGNDPLAVELAREAELAAERGADLVRRLLTFARPEVEQSDTLDLARLVSETAAFASPLLTSRVQLDVSPPLPAFIRGNATAIQQVLLNLVVNARDAMPDGGKIALALATAHIEPPNPWVPPGLAPGSYHVISVADTGHGIPPSIQERIFDPFFTTKGHGEGTGLGLAMSLGIARAHGGWLSVDSTPGDGSTFRLILPALADPRSLAD